jgi:hypothetical protein
VDLRSHATHRRRQHRPPPPLDRALPSVTISLTPGSLAPLHYRIACRDLIEQQRVLARVELAWRILDELARELAA